MFVCRFHLGQKHRQEDLSCVPAEVELHMLSEYCRHGNRLRIFFHLALQRVLDLPRQLCMRQ